MTQSRLSRALTICVVSVLLAVWAPRSSAQEYELYAGLIKSKGYVVGSPLSRSGLHVMTGDTSWTHIGWNTPRVSGLASNPTDGDIMFTGNGNGALRTLDGGKNWRITTDWRVTEAQDVALDPNKPEHIYLATAYGVWRSEDNGESWIESNEGLAKKYTQTIEVDRDDGRVVVATDGGVYVSVDGAVTWKRTSADIPILDIQQSEADAKLWVAATKSSGVLISRDGARTWTPARGRDISGKTIYAVALDPTDANRIAAVGWKTGVVLSSDGGKSWQKRGRRLPSENFYEVVYDPMHPGRLYAATIEKGIFWSDDTGQTWTYAGMDGTLVFDMVFIKRAEG